MLIIRRKEGQSVEITHKSGDVMRIRVCDVRACGNSPDAPGQLNIAFEDDARNFNVQRPERAGKTA